MPSTTPQSGHTPAARCLLGVVCAAVAVLLLCAAPAAAQLSYGDLSASAAGNLSSGYSATYGNTTSSSHNWNVGGTGNFSGAYYNPNFLSYNASVFLNQSRANSDFQSISSASGITLATNLFGGSKFPGSINYARAYNADGNYSIPGVANYVTHGNNQTFGVNWSENLTGKPTFSVGYQAGSSNYSVYGASSDGNTGFHSVNLHSGYLLSGFSLSASYTNGGSHSVIPEVVSGSASSTVNSNSSSYNFGASHSLPMQGSAFLSYGHSNWDTQYLQTSTTGSLNLITALATLHPTSRIAVSVNTNYSDNLAGQLAQTVISSGGVVTGNTSNQSSNSVDLMAVATYSPAPTVQTSGFVERRTQSFEGSDYGVTSYGGSASYARRLLGGSFNTSVTATANSSDNTNSDTLGFSVTQNYSTEALGWHVTESFGYAQNVQTLLVTYTNSYYNYSLNVRRRWGLFSAGAGAGGSRTALTQVAGSGSSSQSYNANVAYSSYITATGTYARSDGEAILTGSGLSTITQPTASSLVSLYGGTAYSFGVSSSPVKKLTLSASYARSDSNTSSTTLSSSNLNRQFNSLIQYQVRKLYFTSGYARLEQGFSNSGTAPETVSSYYLGISRWFNFF
jgi:hypothetical protein